MKATGIGGIALLLFLAIQNAGDAWGQNVPSFNPPEHAAPMWETQPAQVTVVPLQLTNFERYASSVDVPLVHLAFPAIFADLGPHVSLGLTPRGLAPFDAPGALKVLAVEFQLTQSPPVTRSSEASQAHSVTTILDFDELSAFKSVFNALAATGMPQPPFADAKAVVRMTSKTGMHLEFEAEDGGSIRCIVATEADSVTLFLDAASVRKWTDAFVAAFRALDAARDSRT